MQVVALRRYVLPAFLVFVACESSPTPEIASEPEPELPPAEEFRDDPDWTRFPIVIDGVPKEDIDGTPYSIEIDEQTLYFEDFADVVTRWWHFQPCDEDEGEPLDSLNSFFYIEEAQPYIANASSSGLHVIMPLPFWGHSTLECEGHYDPDLGGDGDPDPSLWTHDYGIEIPLHPLSDKTLLDTPFTNYWVAKAATYVAQVDSYDTTDVVWGWRVIEEFNPTQAGELAFALAQRDMLDTEDPGRFKFAYMPNHAMPQWVLWTLLEKGAASTNTATFTLDPPNPIARSSTSAVVGDYYTKPLDVERENSLELIKMFDHIVTGAYSELVLSLAPTVANNNRIHPYHRARLGRETLDILEDIYEENNTEETLEQEVPEHMLFHAPDMTPEIVNMTADHARHDFWAGIHEANGVWIYSYAYDHLNAEVWEEYVRALYLIKSEMRPFLADGPTLVPEITASPTLDPIVEDVYVTAHYDYAPRDDLALPDGSEAYKAINATLFKNGLEGYLVVTNSVELEDSTSVEFDLVTCIDDVTVRTGNSSNMGFQDTILSDDFEAIDGLVYYVEFSSGTCS